MPRARRVDAPGLVHHVWAHAIAGHDLFHDVEDRRDVLVRLSRILPDAGARCFGWTLMSNHLHAVVKTGEQRLGTVMQRVLTGYAMRFNGRAGRRGHLLQGRYGSRPLKDEADLQRRAQQLRAELDLEALIVTRSEEGMSLFTATESRHEHTRAREVYDVSGAGDTVIAVLALMVAGGAPLHEAMRVANHAAGIVVAKLGTAVVHPEELSESLASRH